MTALTALHFMLNLGTYYAERYDAECRYAKCRYAETRLLESKVIKNLWL